VAEVVALVGSTTEGLITKYKAHVAAFRITSSGLDVTADLLALVPLAAFHLVANLGAGEGLRTS